MKQDAHYFYLLVSIADLIQWDDDGLTAMPNKHLQAMLKVLNLNIDLLMLHDHYLDTVRVGQGDVFFYKVSATSHHGIAFDFYKDASDQMDLISIALCCGQQQRMQVRQGIRAFFDSAENSICLEESLFSVRALDILNDKNYPKEFPLSNYRQKQIVKVLPEIE